MYSSTERSRSTRWDPCGRTPVARAQDPVESESWNQKHPSYHALGQAYLRTNMEPKPPHHLNLSLAEKGCTSDEHPLYTHHVKTVEDTQFYPILVDLFRCMPPPIQAQTTSTAHTVLQEDTLRCQIHLGLRTEDCLTVVSRCKLRRSAERGVQCVWLSCPNQQVHARNS